MLLLAEHNLKTIYESLVTNDKVGAYKKVRKAIFEVKRSTKNGLYKDLAYTISYQDFEDAVKALTFSGECKVYQKGSQLWIRWVE